MERTGYRWVKTKNGWHVAQYLGVDTYTMSGVEYQYSARDFIELGKFIDEPE